MPDNNGLVERGREGKRAGVEGRGRDRVGKGVRQMEGQEMRGPGFASGEGRAFMYV